MERAFADLRVKYPMAPRRDIACMHPILELARHDSLAPVERCPVPVVNMSRSPSWSNILWLAVTNGKLHSNPSASNPALRRTKTSRAAPAAQPIGENPVESSDQRLPLPS